MSEQDWIRKYFAPLVSGAGSANLTDDLAELSVDEKGILVATVDALVEGVHFRSSDPIESIARKLVRVNVSDIYSAGALPSEALLTLGWPEGRSEEDLRRFAGALGEDLRRHGARLVGGDTVSSSAGLFLSLTMTGQCLGNKPVRRGGAQAGDDLWLTGVIGAAMRGHAELEAGDNAGIWGAHYQEPALPPPEAAALIARFARAAMDVSDGLLADALKLSQASNVSVSLGLDGIPFAGGAGALEEVLALATWGDDYQLMFSAEKANRSEIQLAAAESGVNIGIVGEIEDGSGLSATFHDVSVNLPETLGFEHGRIGSGLTRP